MRKIPTIYLKPGMKIGRNLYDRHNMLLLSKGHPLSTKEIARIMQLQYRSIYINDEHDSECPESIDDINDTLRHNTISAVKEIFTMIGAQRTLNRNVVGKAKKAVEDIVNEIILNKNATYTMTDLKLFDDYTYYHSVNVTVISVIVGVSLGLSRNSLYKLGLGALMHDIGKIFVPKEILWKNGKLTEEEFGIIKEHSLNGYEYLKSMPEITDESNMAVLTHHEKFNGRGYPYGTCGTNIPLFGRILAVADVFDALTSDRPYRKAVLPSEAVEYVIGDSGHHFDPQIVDAFLAKISPYPVGSYVILSNGQKGVVVSNRQQFGLRPKVKIINDDGMPVYYDLSEDFFDITIKEASYF